MELSECDEEKQKPAGGNAIQISIDEQDRMDSRAEGNTYHRLNQFLAEVKQHIDNQCPTSITDNLKRELTFQQWDAACYIYSILFKMTSP